MADAELNILIKARNQAKKEFDSLNKQIDDLKGKKSGGGLTGVNKKISEFSTKFQSATGMSLGFASAAGLAGVAVTGLMKFLKSAVDETVAYATEIDNFSRLLGLSTEETSRLVQASDDLFISQETLKSGLQAATRQGIDVSIEGLKKLSEQYLALEEGGERSKFVMDTFGRSGAEMGKLMEVGADGIQSAMDAIDDSMIVTKYSMQAIIQYKQSVDDLSDSWQGFLYQVGQEIIPFLDLLFRQLTSGTDAVEEHLLKIEDLEDQISSWSVSAALGSKKAKDKVAELEAEVARLNEEFYGSEDATAQYDEALITLSDEYSNVISLASKLQSVEENLHKAETDLAEYIKNKPWDTKGIEDRKQAVEDLKLEQQKMVDQWMVDVFQKMLMADGELSQAEMDFLLQYQVDTGLISQENAIRAQSYYNQALSIIQSNGLITQSINNIPTLHIAKVKVVTEYSSVGNQGSGFSGVIKSGANITQSTRASGGPAEGLTWVGERGPELLNLPPGSRVYSNQQSQQMTSGNNVNLTFNVSGATDAKKFTRDVMTELKRQLA